MSIKQTVLAGAFTLALLPVATALAGEVTGRVTDSSTGRPLPNATIRIEPLGRTVTADRGGEFRVVDVPAGSCRISG